METVKIEIPIGMRWVITKDEMRNQFQLEDSLLRKHDLEELPGIAYALHIKYDEPADEILIGFGFFMEEETTITADYSISTTGKLFIKQSGIFTQSSEMFGRKIGTLNELFDPEQPKSTTSIAIKSPKNLGEVLWKRNDQDFDIEVDGKGVKVHKCIIGSKSPVFDRMIQNCWKESKESKVKIIDFDFDIVEIAIKFCYGIEVTQFLTASIGTKLLQFSDKYDIDDLKDAMEEYLFNQKSPVNVVEIVNASIHSNSIKLQEQSFNYLLECSQKKIFVKDLESLDTAFAFKLLKASFFR